MKRAGKMFVLTLCCLALLGLQCNTHQQPSQTETPEFFSLRPKVEKEYGYSHAVKIGDDPKLNAGLPTVVFRAPFIAGHEFVQSYDVLPDDRGFVIIRTLGGPEKARINVIQNWAGELKANLPAGR